jgi:hypothetical protein
MRSEPDLTVKLAFTRARPEDLDWPAAGCYNSRVVP